MRYLQVILPLPVGNLFTYSLPDDHQDYVEVGCRVVVPFGANKLYTGVVSEISDPAPEGDFQIKPVREVRDRRPVVDKTQLRLWHWIAQYYICTPGDVMKAALPGGMKLTSETLVRATESFDNTESLSETETLLLRQLANGKRNTITALQKQIKSKNLLKTIRALIDKGAVEISETLTGGFKPKRETHVRLNPKFLNREILNNLFDNLQKTPRRYDLLIKLVEMSGAATAIRFRNPALLEEVSRAELLRQSGVSAAVLLALKAKGIVEIYDYEVKRLRDYNGSIVEQLPLSEAQQTAFDDINRVFRQKDICLLHGVTSSGKTEIYIKLIKQCLAQGKQVLYMLPEIALTTQITKRLQRVFGNELGVYHSKFPDTERVELWQRQLSDKPCGVILGARSSLFLPFHNLGLVIVDEEHETSFKQQDPAPRYNGRDTALMLAHINRAKVLLGTATPSVESYYKAAQGKFGYVRLDKRYGDVMLPQIEVVDVQDLMRRKIMKMPFSPRLEEEIRQALSSGGQVILFQNRRGYAPVVECATCGWTPTCQYCDVSLTYHHDDNKLHCHYCGNTFPVPQRCPNCGGQDLRPHGFGTEKIEEEVKKRFPQARTVRMDLDTTRSRNSYEQIIEDFAAGKTDVLIGTQMVSKGLDFDRVQVVGILDADSIFSLPDFRSYERAFQMMSQVAGRAGRRSRRGLVILQTRRADSPIVSQVVNDDYEGLYHSQLEERRQFYYPPFYRLIYVWFKHREERVVADAATLAAQLMLEAFGGGILGPDKPLVGKVQMLHLRKAALKVSPLVPVVEVRQKLKQIVATLAQQPRFRSVTVYFDVDPL